MSLVSYFNSHPHKEDDNEGITLADGTHISTHILTRRMTKRPARAQAYKDISTHILTRRMTSLRRESVRRQAHFNSHPHKEDDPFDFHETLSIDISTHILTRRMTMSYLVFCVLTYISTHILTRRMT